MIDDDDRPVKNPTVGEFLEMSLDRAWIDYPGLEVYLRVALRTLGGRRGAVIDIGNVNAKAPGNGVFTKFLRELESEALSRNFDGIFVQNVLSSRFCRFFETHGYRLRDKESGDGPEACYFKLLGIQHETQ